MWKQYKCELKDGLLEKYINYQKNVAIILIVVAILVLIIF